MRRVSAPAGGWSSRLWQIAAVLALPAVCWVLYFHALGAVPLHSIGEARESVQVVDAVERGDWILPLRNGTELPSKPPLFHWSAALIALASGGTVDEWAVRLPAALAALAAVLAVVAYGWRRWDAAAGLYAGLMLATSANWIRWARNARTDLPLVAGITAACICFERAIASSPPAPLMLWGWYVAMGLATLAKGPIGLVLPLLVAAVHLLVTGQLRRVRELRLARGLALAVALPATWYAAATAVGGWPFVRKQLLRENVLRALGTGAAPSNESHPLWYYATEFVAGFAPWSVLVIPLAIFLVQQRRRPEILRPYVFPLVWFGVTLALFTVAAGKRANYILPAYPAAALLFGAWWSALAQSGSEGLHPVLRGVLRAGCAVAAGVAALTALLLALHAVGADPLAWIAPLLHRRDRANLPLVRAALDAHPDWALAWGATLLAAAALLWRDVRGTIRWPRVFAAIVLVVVASSAVITQTYLPLLAADRTYKPFLAAVRALAGGQPLAFYGPFDYGAVFYAGHHIPSLGGRLPEGDAPRLVLFREPEWEGLDAAARAHGEILARSRGRGPDGDAMLLLVRVHPPGAER